MKNIDEVWEKVEDPAKAVCWHHTVYRVVKKKSNDCDFQKAHFSYRDGYILVVDHENGSGGIIHESYFDDLFYMNITTFNQQRKNQENYDNRMKQEIKWHVDNAIEKMKKN